MCAINVLRDLALAGVLFHELGHHLDATVGAAARAGERAAEDWSVRLHRQYFRRRYRGCARLPQSAGLSFVGDDGADPSDTWPDGSPVARRWSILTDLVLDLIESTRLSSLNHEDIDSVRTELVLFGFALSDVLVCRKRLDKFFGSPLRVHWMHFR